MLKQRDEQGQENRGTTGMHTAGERLDEKAFSNQGRWREKKIVEEGIVEGATMNARRSRGDRARFSTGAPPFHQKWEDSENRRNFVTLRELSVPPHA